MGDERIKFLRASCINCTFIPILRWDFWDWWNNWDWYFLRVPLSAGDALGTENINQIILRIRKSLSNYFHRIKQKNTSGADPVRVCVPREGFKTQGSAVLLGIQNNAVILNVTLSECCLKDEGSCNPANKSNFSFLKSKVVGMGTQHIATRMIRKVEKWNLH